MKTLMRLSFFIGCPLFIYGLISYGNNMPATLLIISVTLLAISLPDLIQDYGRPSTDKGHVNKDGNKPKLKEPNKKNLTDDISEFTEGLDIESIEFVLYSEFREEWAEKIKNVQAMPKGTVEEIMARKECIDNITPSIWWMIDSTISELTNLKYQSDAIIKTINERYTTYFGDEISINRLNGAEIVTINASVECGIKDNKNNFTFLICEHDLTFYLVIKDNGEVIYQLSTSDYEFDPILGALYYFHEENPSDIAKSLSWVESFHRVGCLIQKLESNLHHQEKSRESAQIAKLNS